MQGVQLFVLMVVMDHVNLRSHIQQGCESSSFQMISSFLKKFLCQNFSFFFDFQPSFGCFTQFHTVFPQFLSVASHTPNPGWLTSYI